ncbi:MAG: hypothetical protein AABW51_05240 [Nanoarchaeota archaeon]
MDLRKTVTGIVTVSVVASYIGIKANQEKNLVERIAITHNISYDVARAYYSAGLPVSYLTSKGGLEKIMANGGTSDIIKRIVDLNREPSLRKEDFSPYEFSLLENENRDSTKRAEVICQWMELGADIYTANVYISNGFNFQDFAKFEGMNIPSYEIDSLIAYGAEKELVHAGFTNKLTKDDISRLARGNFDSTKTYSQQVSAELVRKGWKVYEIEYVANMQVPFESVKAMMNKGMKKGEILRKLDGK